VLALALFRVGHSAAWRSRRPRRGPQRVPRSAGCTARAVAATARPQHRRAGNPTRRRVRLARRQRRPVRRAGHAQPPARRDRVPSVDAGDHALRPPDHPRFLDDDQVRGIIEWSEASLGDALYDLVCSRSHTRTPRRRHRRLRGRPRHRLGRRMVVVSKPDRHQVAGRERLCLRRKVPRGRCAEITAVRRREHTDRGQGYARPYRAPCGYPDRRARVPLLARYLESGQNMNR
jgi:hypothetical protein